MSLRLLVGLGNPGPEYQRTRHNAGVWLLEQLVDAQRLTWHHEARFQGRVAKWSGDEPLWLLCPATYMNRSGLSVGALARFYRLEPKEILVVHDELDFEAGTVRLKQGGGSGGHNGLKDIMAHLGGTDFWRLRVGIGHPGKGADVADYVLNRPLLAEEQAIEQALLTIIKVMPLLREGQFQTAMGVLHSQPQATRESSS